ncbi:Lrp/AsnC ligand binding domain-containing protein [Mesorhizobium sp. M0048]
MVTGNADFVLIVTVEDVQAFDVFVKAASGACTITASPGNCSLDAFHDAAEEPTASASSVNESRLFCAATSSSDPSGALRTLPRCFHRASPSAYRRGHINARS